MQTLLDLFRTESAAGAVLIIALVALVGLALGSITISGIRLGIAGVLFAGLAAGHVGLKLNHDMLEFIREFGLILFVYTIGIQVGPGFVASLRKDGLPLNIMAASIVIGGALLTVLIWFVFLDRAELPAAVGIFSGASTNTPSLAASGQALRDMTTSLDESTRAQLLKQPAMAYAVTYPFGIIGIILAMLMIKRFFKVDIESETKQLAQVGVISLAERDIRVDNKNLASKPMRLIPTLASGGVVVSRVLRLETTTHVPGPEFRIEIGDVIHAVGTEEALDQLETVVGHKSSIDVKSRSTHINARRIIVTSKAVLGKTLANLNLRDRFDVNLTRVVRNGVELPVSASTKLSFGDRVVVVGEPVALDAIARELGDSSDALNHPMILPIFVGIALGVIVGSIPFSIPGIPAPIKLGLAGGPLVVAIILSRIGKIGPMVWHLPTASNLVLREIGIVMFLAVVGIKGGDTFVSTLMTSGVKWVLIGGVVTLLPLMVVAMVARVFYKLNYLSLCGLLAGSMTDPPALSFAAMVTKSDTPHVAYASVYPLVMLLRVVCAQLIVLLLFE